MVTNQISHSFFLRGGGGGGLTAEARNEAGPVRRAVVDMGIRPKTPPPLPTRRRVPSIQQNPSTPSLSKTKKKKSKSFPLSNSKFRIKHAHAPLSSPLSIEARFSAAAARDRITAAGEGRGGEDAAEARGGGHGGGVEGGGRGAPPPRARVMVGGAAAAGPRRPLLRRRGHGARAPRQASAFSSPFTSLPSARLIWAL